MKKTDHDQKTTKDVVNEAAEEHPLATEIGAITGAATGAIIGSALGPVGALTGALIGGSTGVIAGKGIAASFDPSAEEAYWEEKHREARDSGQPEYAADYSFDELSPAYRLGWQLFAPGVSFEAVENDLKKRWETDKGNSRLTWDEVRLAALSSWTKMEESRKPRQENE